MGRTGRPVKERRKIRRKKKSKWRLRIWTLRFLRKISFQGPRRMTQEEGERCNGDREKGGSAAQTPRAHSDGAFGARLLLIIIHLPVVRRDRGSSDLTSWLSLFLFFFSRSLSICVHSLRRQKSSGSCVFGTLIQRPGAARLTCVGEQFNCSCLVRTIV